MNEKHYYEAPSDEIFTEVKVQAIMLWRSYDDTHGYATEKISRVNELDNIKDNFMTIFAMFDDKNQRLLANVLSPEAKEAIRSRLIAGGAPDYYYPYLK